MKLSYALAFALAGVTFPAIAQDTPASVVEGQGKFDMTVLATGLEGPWELTWGPDDFLWVTERTGGRITRINPVGGSQSVAITIAEVSAPGGQDGLMGLALHPELGAGTGNDFVFTAYTYIDKDRGPDETVTNKASPYRFLYAKIIRLTYDPVTGLLSNPVELIAGLPAGGDHNSGRLKIGPDGKLYYTIGDQGNQQFGNSCIPIEAQTLPTAEDVVAGNMFPYQGKSLRLNLDGSIPDDNPEINGVRSHVFTYGHRNMQGLDFAPDGTLYAAEHGPKADDEVNVLRAGENYGWPHISGFVDDMAYQNANWPEARNCEKIQFSDLKVHRRVPVEKETDWPGTAQDPVVTMFTVPSDWDFSDPVCEGMDFICWPTVAPSSMEVYMPETGAIPGWENSLIVTALKRGSVYLVPLAEDGQSLRGPIERHFRSENRFRDTAVSPDNRTIYVATDPGGVGEALGGGHTFEMQNPGAILAFTYVGDG